jgi:hypothetical protein
MGEGLKRAFAAAKATRKRPTLRKPIPSKFSVERSLERDDYSIPCKCGGYADRVSCTADEIAKYGCGRPWECCSRAFVCRKCKTRYVGTAPAPEMR